MKTRAEKRVFKFQIYQLIPIDNKFEENNM